MERSKWTICSENKLPEKILVTKGNTNIQGSSEKLLDFVELVYGGGKGQGSIERSAQFSIKQSNIKKMKSLLFKSRSSKGIRNPFNMSGELLWYQTVLLVRAKENLWVRHRFMGFESKFVGTLLPLQLGSLGARVTLVHASIIQFIGSMPLDCP